MEPSQVKGSDGAQPDIIEPIKAPHQTQDVGQRSTTIDVDNSDPSDVEKAKQTLEDLLKDYYKNKLLRGMASNLATFYCFLALVEFFVIWILKISTYVYVPISLILAKVSIPGIYVIILLWSLCDRYFDDIYLFCDRGSGNLARISGFRKFDGPKRGILLVPNYLGWKGWKVDLYIRWLTLVWFIMSLLGIWVYFLPMTPIVSVMHFIWLWYMYGGERLIDQRIFNDMKLFHLKYKRRPNPHPSDHYVCSIVGAESDSSDGPLLVVSRQGQGLEEKSLISFQFEEHRDEQVYRPCNNSNNNNNE